MWLKDVNTKDVIELSEQKINQDIVGIIIEKLGIKNIIRGKKMKEIERFDNVVIEDLLKSNKSLARTSLFLLFLFIILGLFIALCFYNDYIDFNRNRIAPSDRIQEKDILVYEDKIIINISNASYSNYLNTGSMLPTLNENSNGISINPKNENDIRIGDIITYETLTSCIIPNDVVSDKEVCTPTELIVHRVKEIGEDEEGWYAITKGDMNSISDGKIRYSQIKSITFVIIY